MLEASFISDGGRPSTSVYRGTMEVSLPFSLQNSERKLIRVKEMMSFYLAVITTYLE